MANSRADEMVLAGSAPIASPGSDPIAHIHRGTSFIVLVDGAIVVYLFATPRHHGLVGRCDGFGGSRRRGVCRVDDLQGLPQSKALGVLACGLHPVPRQFAVRHFGLR